MEGCGEKERTRWREGGRERGVGTGNRERGRQGEMERGRERNAGRVDRNIYIERERQIDT